LRIVSEEDVARAKRDLRDCRLRNSFVAKRRWKNLRINFRSGHCRSRLLYTDRGERIKKRIRLDVSNAGYSFGRDHRPAKLFSGDGRRAYSKLQRRLGQSCADNSGAASADCRGSKPGTSVAAFEGRGHANCMPRVAPRDCKPRLSRRARDLLVKGLSLAEPGNAAAHGATRRWRGQPSATRPHRTGSGRNRRSIFRPSLVAGRTTLHRRALSRPPNLSTIGRKPQRPTMR